MTLLLRRAASAATGYILATFGLAAVGVTPALAQGMATAAPGISPADTAWMTVATAFVLMMTKIGRAHV